MTTSTSKKILVSVGEISADMFTADLIRALHNERPGVSFIGMGGPRMREAGAAISVDLTAHSTVGLIEVIEHIPAVARAYRTLIRLMDTEKPDLVLLVDFQGFNMIIAKAAKKRGIKTVYFIPPQEWLWGTEKGVQAVVNNVDTIIGIFKEEAEAYAKKGARVIYFGHPLVDKFPTRMPRAQARRQLDIPESASPVISLFPGSRKQEVNRHLPILLDTAAALARQYPFALFLLSCVSPRYKETCERALSRTPAGRSLSGRVRLIEGRSDLLLQSADLALLSSGTITLEAALTQTPMVVIYRFSRLTEFIARKILHIGIQQVSLPNILMKNAVVPECLQKNATPEKIAATARLFLDSPEIRVRYEIELGKIRDHLGEAPVTTRIAHELAAIL